MLNKVKEFLDIKYSDNPFFERENREKRSLIYNELTKEEKDELFSHLKNNSDDLFPRWFPNNIFKEQSLIMNYIEYLGPTFIYDKVATDALYHVLEFHYEDLNWDWADIYCVREELVKYFIDNGFDVNHVNENYSFFHSCLANIQCDAIKPIVEKGVDLNHLDPYGSSVLMCTLERYENIETFSYLFNQKKLNPKVGDNILSFTFEKGYYKEVIQIILDSVLGQDLIFLQEALNTNDNEEKKYFLIRHIANIEKNQLDKHIAQAKESKKLRV